MEKTSWSIIPRRCSCGCGKLYFSPMWRVLSDYRAIPDIAVMDRMYQYFSVKEFPSPKQLPKVDVRISDNVWMDPTHIITGDEWDVITSKMTKSEFTSINYKIHVFPLSMDSTLPFNRNMDFVVMCVQEIPDVIVIGSNYADGMEKIKKKLEDWFDIHTHSSIPMPQPYDETFRIHRTY